MQDIDYTDELVQYYNETIKRPILGDRKGTKRLVSILKIGIKTIGPLLKRLRSSLRDDMTVLELGCGAGELLYSIKSHVKKVVGIEIHKGFVDFMNDELNIEAYAEDVNRFHLPLQSLI